RMEAPVYSIRHADEARSLSNSLQLEVTTDTDCYITIVDVDAEGNVNVLFPNPYQKQSFYPDGFVRANKAVLVPDSLRSGNRAGFHFDYANPAGVDTIRVFATTDLRLAEKIRRSVQPSRPVESNKTTIVGRPIVQLASLRQELVGSLTRGLITVPDEPTQMSAQEEMPMMAQVQEVAEPEQYEEVEEYVEEGQDVAEGFVDTAEYEEEAAQSEFQAIPVQQNIPDWTAASVTVLVSE
ncbi:MAG: DUF4384 domain-containing protein, partial [Nitrospirales bacterium]